MAHADTYPAIEDLTEQDRREHNWPYQDVVITTPAMAEALLAEAKWSKDRNVRCGGGHVEVFTAADAAVAFTRQCAMRAGRRSPSTDGEHLYHKLVGFETGDPVAEVQTAMADPAKVVLRQLFRFREDEEVWFSVRARNRLTA